MAKRKQPKGVRPKPKNPWKRYGETYSHAPDWSDCCGPITVENGYSDADVYELTQERRQEVGGATEICQPANHELTPEQQARIDFLAEQEEWRRYYHNMEDYCDVDFDESEYNI